jgi:hypothetical protein
MGHHVLVVESLLLLCIPEMETLENEKRRECGRKRENRRSVGLRKRMRGGVEERREEVKLRRGSGKTKKNKNKNKNKEEGERERDQEHEGKEKL